MDMNERTEQYALKDWWLSRVVARDHVRLLGATISSDLSLDRHVSVVSASGFYWLRKLQCCRRSLDTQSAATLVHSFVSSRVDYCNALLDGAQKVTTDKLQRVMNAAARVITGTHKFDRGGLSRILHTELHWLNVPERFMLCTSSASRSTWSTSAYQSPTSLLGSISGPPVDDSWSFCDTGCKRTADGLSLLLARRPGTHCLTILETRTLAETASANFWNRICSLVTETSSALEVLRECAIQIYLLTWSRVE